MISGMTHYEIVTRLIGPIRATGEHGVDGIRLKNLKTLTDLLERLLQDINHAANDRHRHEASVRAIGICAAEFLEAIHEETNP